MSEDPYLSEIRRLERELATCRAFLTDVLTEIDRLRFYETTSAAEAIREVLRMRPVYEAAKAWAGAGGNPCAMPDCRCTECELWAAVIEARRDPFP